MPHNINHIGEKQIQNCGLEAKIIDYRNNRDVDVQFPDRTEIKHRRYEEFRHGKICHPNIGRYEIYMKKRIGEKRMQNCGLEAKIIAYRKSTDIDIEFSDGTKVKHKDYNKFIKGKIRHPKIKLRRKRMCERIKEKQVQNCGLEAEIIEYYGVDDMTIIFSDKIIRTKKSYSCFQQKRIGHPTINPHFCRSIGTIHPKDKSKIYHTNIQGIAYVMNNTYYYFCHCPICNAHEIWTFDEIKNHKCNHRLVKERKELAQAYIEMIQSTQ